MRSSCSGRPLRRSWYAFRSSSKSANRKIPENISVFSPPARGLLVSSQCYFQNQAAHARARVQGKTEDFSHGSIRYLKQVPFARDGFQSMYPAVHELNVRTRYQSFYRAGKQNFVGMCQGAHPCRDIYR